MRTVRCIYKNYYKELLANITPNLQQQKIQ